MFHSSFDNHCRGGSRLDQIHRWDVDVPRDPHEDLGHSTDHNRRCYSNRERKEITTEHLAALQVELPE
jgi:hypothetical protein